MYQLKKHFFWRENSNSSSFPVVGKSDTRVTFLANDFCCAVPFWICTKATRMNALDQCFA